MSLPWTIKELEVPYTSYGEWLALQRQEFSEEETMDEKLSTADFLTAQHEALKRAVQEVETRVEWDGGGINAVHTRIPPQPFSAAQVEVLQELIDQGVAARLHAVAAELQKLGVGSLALAIEVALKRALVATQAAPQATGGCRRCGGPVGTGYDLCGGCAVNRSIKDPAPATLSALSRCCRAPIDQCDGRPMCTACRMTGRV